MQVQKVNFKFGNNPEWALENKVRGRVAFNCAAAGLGLGLVKPFINEDSIWAKVVNFFQGIFYGERGFNQYSINSRKDDDLGMDKIQSPIAGAFGSVTCFVERYIKPIVYPLSAFLNNNLRTAILAVLNSFGPMWWRLRSALLPKNWKGIKELKQDIKELFSKKLSNQTIALGKIDKTLSPFFSLLAFLGLFISTPFKAWNRWKGNESKLVNEASAIGSAAQHEPYIARFTFPAWIKYKETGSKNALTIFLLGAANNFFNLTFPIVELLPLSKRTKALWREIAQGIVYAFFSKRREIKGTAFLAGNQSDYKL